MSETVSNVEIEDVLSSIRRLVSEDHRSIKREPPRKSQAQKGRLVLTPALRVAEFPQPEPEEDLDFAEDFEPEQGPQDQSDFLPDVDSGLAAESESQDQDPAEVSADQPWPEAHQDPQETPWLAPEPEAELDSGAQEHQDPDSGTNGAQHFLNGAPWLDPDATLFEVAQSMGEAAEVEDADTDFDDSTRDGDAQPDTPEPEQLADQATDLEMPEEDSEDHQPESYQAEDHQPEAYQAEDRQPEAYQAEDHQPEEYQAGDHQPEAYQAEDHQPEAYQAEDHQSGDDAPRAEMTGDSPTDIWSDAMPDQAETPMVSDQDISANNTDLDDNDGAETPDQDSPADTADDDQYDRTAALSAKIAALEATIGRTQDQWEPDGEVGDDYAGTHVETIEWQDHDAADDATAETPRPTPLYPDKMDDTPEAAQQQEEPLDVLANDETILDEESLRELVADIVRQELQGALGERITRNVRKLVRREIHRALTAQELD